VITEGGYVFFEIFKGPIDRLTQSVVDPVVERVLSLSWFRRLLILSAMLALGWSYLYYRQASNAARDSYDLVVVSRSQSVPLSSTDTIKLHGHIDSLADHLRAELSKRGTPGNYTSWTIGQIIVSLQGRSTAEANDLALFFEKQDADTDCWKQLPTEPQHLVATSWVLTALADTGTPLGNRGLACILDSQNQEGWWPLFWPATRDRFNASTDATAWSILALDSQLRHDTIPKEKVQRATQALQNGRSWLEETRIQGKARWYDYPFSPEQIESVSASGLVLHVLHQTGAGPSKELDGIWLDSLPDHVFFADQNEVSSHATALLPEGTFHRDATRQYVLPWLLVATVDAYPASSSRQRVKALRLVRGCLTTLEESERRVLQFPWAAAEFEIALRYLNNDRIAGNRIL
jgi:hypothetical protein